MLVKEKPDRNKRLFPIIPYNSVALETVYRTGLLPIPITIIKQRIPEHTLPYGTAAEVHFSGKWQMQSC